LIAIAWDTGRIRDGQYTAQQLLLRQERISTWSTDEERGQMMVYCREHLSHLIQGLVQVFTTTQQRDLLFNHALTDKDRDSNSLPQPEPYHQAFTGNEERMNLARWLMRQAKLISTRSWLAWVIHFELVSLPGIGPRLTQRIELELGRLYGEELGIALKLLGQAKSQTA
ncbi:MAG: hypothetical protein NTV06_04055, partial [candidate division Zixibacteria bacterium]|nr:hypothetical protein [candidate division Zixibacteria bacterium]